MMAKLVHISAIGPPTRTNVDPEARQLVISQLLVIAVPVGTLFGVWLWMLNWSERSRRDQ